MGRVSIVHLFLCATGTSHGASGMLELSLSGSGVMRRDTSYGLLKLNKAVIRHDGHREEYRGQVVHWVFVTDCSAYQYNQGNMLLASAKRVGQPGNFTWITYGCQREEQKAAFVQLSHPQAQVWHQPETALFDPGSGAPVSAFQASNRPVSIIAWYRAVRPQEEAIAVLDPDMFFLRAVHLVKQPLSSNTRSDEGPWKILEAKKGQGVAARYGIGCTMARFNDTELLSICGDAFKDKCMEAKSNQEACADSYSSGPPWIVQKSDAENVFGSWVSTAIRVHHAWPDLLAEQSAFGISQAQLGVKNDLDTFWMLSNPDDGSQPWNHIARADWDPCKSRQPQPKDLPLPPIFHACSTFKMPEHTLHKDHIHKDLLDCQAPLLEHPPRDSLLKFADKEKRNGLDFRNTWAVCMYTNLVNAYATMWKQQFCDKPNLEPTFKYPSHAQSFLNENSWMVRVFRRGGWTDIDYKPSG